LDRESEPFRHQKFPVISFIKNSYPHCLVLVGSRNGFERDFTIELKQIEGLIVDSNLCKKAPSLNNVPQPRTKEITVSVYTIVVLRLKTC